MSRPVLPFTGDVFLSSIAHYNEAIWPAQVVAYVLGFAVLALVLRPSPAGDRVVALILAAGWAWSGIAWHYLHFATINFAAPLFAALFVAEALLLAWSGALRGRLGFRFRRDAFGRAGLATAVAALVLYPLLGVLAGHAWPALAMFGVAPCPLVVFTMGLLLMAGGRTPLHLVAIPVLWSLVGGSAAWLLDVPEDLLLPVAGLGGLVLIVIRNRRHRARAA